MIAIAAGMMFLFHTTFARAAQLSSGQGMIGIGAFQVSVDFSQAVYKVSVSTKVNVYLDPYELLEEGSNITSDDFTVINKSSVPIAVNATVQLNGTAEQNVTLVETKEEITEENREKLAYVEAEIPATVQETTNSVGMQYQDSKFLNAFDLYKCEESGEKYYKTAAGDGVTNEQTIRDEVKDTTAAAGVYHADSTKVAISPKENGTMLRFVLDKADYIAYYETYDAAAPIDLAFQKVAAEQKGSAVFRLSGKLNTEAKWEDKDIEGVVTYTFEELSIEEYENQLELETAHAYIGTKESGN